MTTTTTPTRERVGAELARLRSLAGLSGRQLAGRLSISQPTVSRLEAGDSLPSLPVARAWLDAVHADDAARALVLALVETGHSETVAYRKRLRSDRHMQGHVSDIESRTRALYCVEGAVVPGLLQVPDYADRLMRLADTELQIDQTAALEARILRQARLQDDSRRFGFVLLEQALRSPLMTSGQLERLAQVATGRPHVNLGIVPAAAPWPAVPWNGFVLYELDDGTAIVLSELMHGESTVTGDDDVALYRRLYDQWSTVAITGPPAADLCRALAADLG